ncbi:conserved hypothetical protein [Tenacibaculum sp. 190524A05c]|uniref:hypothetical protein n=1 Tax=Tenacibaculum platacis TaxID=3137852 RepID=UPI0031FB186A
MNQNILKYVAKAMFVFLLASCSKEKETITISEDDITIESQILEVDQLPKNAISAEKILIDNGITPNKKQEEIVIKSRTLGPDEVYVYELYFFVYPPDWGMAQRLNYLQQVRQHREVFVVTDGCQFIDTWYLQVVRKIPFGKNKSKNVITATTTNADLDEVDQDDEEDGPGEVETEVYYTCEQIQLPPIYDGLTFDPFLKPGNVVILDPNKGDNANTPIE